MRFRDLGITRKRKPQARHCKMMVCLVIHTCHCDTSLHIILLILKYSSDIFGIFLIFFAYIQSCFFYTCVELIVYSCFSRLGWKGLQYMFCNHRNQPKDCTECTREQIYVLSSDRIMLGPSWAKVEKAAEKLADAPVEPAQLQVVPAGEDMKEQNQELDAGATYSHRLCKSIHQKQTICHGLIRLR